MLGRMFGRGGAKAENTGEDPKTYKKADLGKPNAFYFSKELGMWVEKGKEAEARAAKEKANAPPPSVGTLSAASSATSLATMTDAASPAPASLFNRPAKGLTGRYVQVMPTVGAANGSPAPAAGKGLLPGMAAGRLPGIPAPPAGGSGPPSLFMPTPVASELGTSEAINGSEVGSVSGFSGVLDASMPNSRSASQPNFFMPGAAASEAAAAEAADESHQHLMASMLERKASAGSCAGPEEQQQQLPRSAGQLLRVSEASGSSRLPALSGPSSVSFTAWQQQPRHSVSLGPHDTSTGSTAASAPPGREVLLRQPGSSADTEADAKAEVSAGPDLFPGKQQSPVAGQQQQQQHGQWPEAAYGNGTYAPYNAAAADAGAAAAAEPAANGDHNAAAAAAEEQQRQEQQEQPLLASELSAGWDSRPVHDPFDASAQAGPAQYGAAGGECGAAGGEYGWEGGQAGATAEGQQQQQYDYYFQQQQDPLAAGVAAEGQPGGEWGMPDGMAWEQQGPWRSGWGSGEPLGDPEGAGGTTDGAAAWPQEQPAEEQQQQHGGYYGGYEQLADAGYAAAYGQQASAEQGGPTSMDYSYQQQQGVDGAAAYDGFYQAAASAGIVGQQQQHQEGQQPVAVLEPVHPPLPGISVSAQDSGSMASPTHGQPGSSGSRGGSSKGRLRQSSMPGSPPGHAANLRALLPLAQPRHSVSGLSGHKSTGPELQGEAAVMLPTAAAAGDSSMLTTVRPSSPYAHAVSPLSRTSTGAGDIAAVSKQSSGGFPIPSPPGHSGLISSRTPSGNIFMPGVPPAAAAAAAPGAPVPWQPGTATDPAAAAGLTQPVPFQPQQWGSANGYDPAAYNQWQQQQHEMLQARAHQGTWGGMQQPQVHAAGAAAAAAPPGAAAGANGDINRSSQRAHPYDQFLARALSQVNWRAVHYKQPGKLNKLLPWEEWEMQKAQQEEQQQQASGEGSKSPFWYRQMEFRQKLPAGAAKQSASEPAAMPSYALYKAAGPPSSQPAATAAAAAAGQGAYGGWHQHHLHQQEEPPMAASPITPARAATTGAIGAVAAGGLHDHAEPTPTSRLMPVAEVSEAEMAEAAGAEAGVGAATPTEGLQAVEAAGAAAFVDGQQAMADGQQQQQQEWAGWSGPADPQVAASGYWQQEQYGQQYGDYAAQQQYYPEQQQEQYGAYDMSGWQQEQQQQQQYSAAATEEAGGAWGAGVGPQVLDLQLGVAVEAPSAAALADTAAAADGATAAPAAAAAHELHSADVIAAARAARLSTSSLGLESQPSTGRVAAAAAKRIVSSALANIMQQYAVPEEAEQEAAAAAGGAVEGWEGGWEGGEVDATAAQQQADAAGEQPEEGEEEEGPTAPVSAAWLKLSQQFLAAADTAASMGVLDDSLAQYKDFFVQYGDYLLGALPREALEQAGLLAQEAAAASSSRQQQEEEEEEQEELYAEFGRLQIKDDVSAGLSVALGYNMDTLLSCLAEA